VELEGQVDMYEELVDAEVVLVYVKVPLDLEYKSKSYKEKCTILKSCKNMCIMKVIKNVQHESHIMTNV